MISLAGNTTHAIEMLAENKGNMEQVVQKRYS